MRLKSSISVGWELAEGARYILLGEHDHGCASSIYWKLVFLRHRWKEGHQIRVMLELGQFEVTQLGKALARSGDISHALSVFLPPIMRSTSYEQLFRLIQRSWQTPNPIEIEGIDFRFSSGQSARLYVESHSARLPLSLQDRMHRLAQWTRRPWEPCPKEVNRNMEEHLEQMTDLGHNVNYARLLANGIRQLEPSGYARVAADAGVSAFNYRDAVMAERLLGKKDMHENPAVIVWTANVHAAKTLQFVEDHHALARLHPIGEHLVTETGSVFSIGTTPQRGWVRDSFTQQRRRLEDAKKPALECLTLFDSRLLTARDLHCSGVTSCRALGSEFTSMRNWDRAFDALQVIKAKPVHLVMDP